MEEKELSETKTGRKEGIKGFAQTKINTLTPTRIWGAGEENKGDADRETMMVRTLFLENSAKDSLKLGFQENFPGLHK